MSNFVWHDEFLTTLFTWIDKSYKTDHKWFLKKLDKTLHHLMLFIKTGQEQEK